MKTMAPAAIVILIAIACDNATYAPGYSEASFAKVRVGMSVAEVKALLGEPLASEESTPGEVWRYGEISGESQGPRTWKFRIAGDPVVVFAEDGKVQQAYEAPGIEQGMSMEEVRGVLGNPAARDVLRNSLVLHYSSPGESGRSEIRSVGIDREGKVSAISSYSTYD